MAENEPQSPTQPAQQNVTLEQVSALITERFTDFYKFAATQISESRTSTERYVSESRTNFERFYKNTIAAIALVASATIAGAFFLFGNKYKDIEQSVSEKADAHLKELDEEIIKNIKSRTEDEFKTPRIQKIIQEVAHDETAKAVQNESSSWHRNVDAFHADVNRYVMPRRVTAKQKADLIDYLSRTQSKAVVTVRSDPTDPEADNYAGEIWNALQDKATGWEAKLDISHPPPPHIIGVFINVEQPGQPTNPDPKHPTPDSLLGEAFKHAQINYSGMSTTTGQQSYSLYVVVGRRPLDISYPQKPGLAKH